MWTPNLVLQILPQPFFSSPSPVRICHRSNGRNRKQEKLIAIFFWARRVDQSQRGLVPAVPLERRKIDREKNPTTRNGEGKAPLNINLHFSPPSPSSPLPPSLSSPATSLLLCLLSLSSSSTRQNDHLHGPYTLPSPLLNLLRACSNKRMREKRTTNGCINHAALLRLFCFLTCNLYHHHHILMF